MKTVKWLGFVLISLFTQCLAAKIVNVAVAANFSHPIRSLIVEFEKTSDFQIAPSFGSSGKFYAQIKQGAPYEIFFSADQATPEALQQDGLVIETSRFTYAIGRLALWSPQPECLNNVESILKLGRFNKLAVANPKLAPYGAATLEVLEHLALVDRTRAKWVIGENIAQTYQFVFTGNADLGFVALSQLVSVNKSKHVEQGSYWLIPDDMHQAIKQDVVLLHSAENSEGAKAFLDFMHTPKAQNIIQSYGYLNNDKLELSL